MIDTPLDEKSDTLSDVKSDTLSDVKSDTQSDFSSDTCKSSTTNHFSEVAFITLTNSGYINYTLNCIKSLKLINFKGKIHVYCIGKSGASKLAERNIPYTYINDILNSNIQVYRRGNWSRIIRYKFDIIYENLLNYKYVCFTDGDIVYRNPDFLQYCLANIGKHELLIQNDSLKDKSDNLCSGFMFIKSTENTRKLFNPEQIKQYIGRKMWGGQIYVNEIKAQLNFKTLPLELFPNGNYYYKIASKHENGETPYMIHFNWVKGDRKKLIMHKYWKWFI